MNWFDCTGTSLFPGDPQRHLITTPRCTEYPALRGALHLRILANPLLDPGRRASTRGHVIGSCAPAQVWRWWGSRRAISSVCIWASGYELALERAADGSLHTTNPHESFPF
ncbi:hypothetical protein PAXRUDRAFT_820966 [Paxillus rubicundulus Ve08.2h10]|uniref:Uncharacterized protein n=1 Tax=Paxillus rubicundulus Ve08.2h10 TaxID=930991 RepID=A0A0D0EDE2_9AGAM|nr:hypothetical protein PAXRUDRAFT_820966 [Paxillus rubicundulus Ve08.2h10]